jgi:hypothetical protein
LSPYEQNTQQSPGFGVITASQAAHWWIATQPLVGIVSIDAWPQAGHVRVAASSATRRLSPAPAPQGGYGLGILELFRL